MPLYDHECKECGTITEAVSGMDERIIDCQCGGKAERVFSTGFKSGHVKHPGVIDNDPPWLKDHPMHDNSGFKGCLPQRIRKNPKAMERYRGRQGRRQAMKDFGLFNETTGPKG
jgi:putative FmdB family regulatory protein